MTLHMMRTPSFIAWSQTQDCLEPTQYSCVLYPNYIKAQVVMVCKATWPSPGSLAKPSPCIPGNDPFVLCGPTSLALWIKCLEYASTSHLNPTLNQPEIEWSPLHVLHGGSGGRYEVAPLVAPKTVTQWARTLLHHMKRFKLVECWWLGGIYRCWFWLECLF